MQRPEGQDLDEALSDINARLLAAATPLQREILETSTLDDSLRAAERADGGPSVPIGFPEEHSLRAFLPRRGSGLAMSASDIETYRSCPLRYKFARVLRIPTEQTIHQRFGIVVHQVLERYHSEGATTLAGLLELLDTGWRRAGFGREDREGELYEKARSALTTYHARLHGQDSEPVWFERAFSFRLGPHHLRGRVDRVDRLAAGGEVEYELIDYKTSRPKSTEQLRDDVQLSLYALAAREDWRLESSRQAYYYVLDDVRVPVPRDERDADAVRALVLEVGEGILAQDFEPTPSPSACSICDYRIVCPAAGGRLLALAFRAGAESAGIRGRSHRPREPRRARSARRSRRPARDARRKPGCPGRSAPPARPGARSRPPPTLVPRRPRRPRSALPRAAAAPARPSGWPPPPRSAERPPTGSPPAGRRWRRPRAGRRRSPSGPRRRRSRCRAGRAARDPRRGRSSPPAWCAARRRAAPPARRPPARQALRRGRRGSRRTSASASRARPPGPARGPAAPAAPSLRRSRRRAR